MQKVFLYIWKSPKETNKTMHSPCINYSQHREYLDNLAQRWSTSFQFEILYY